MSLTVIKLWRHQQSTTTFVNTRIGTTNHSPPVEGSNSVLPPGHPFSLIDVGSVFAAYIGFPFFLQEVLESMYWQSSKLGPNIIKG